MPRQTPALCGRDIVTEVVSDSGTRLMRKLLLEIIEWQSVPAFYSSEDFQVCHTTWHFRSLQPAQQCRCFKSIAVPEYGAMQMVIALTEAVDMELESCLKRYRFLISIVNGQ